MNVTSKLYSSFRLASILLVLVSIGLACKSGVSDEDFKAVQQELAAEKARAASLEVQLTREDADAATLQSMLDKAELRNAELESE